MTTSTAVPADHPLMLAWNAYKATEDFANTKRWATREEHTEGSLWAAFMSGFLAAESRAEAAEAKELLVEKPPAALAILTDHDDVLGSAIKEAEESVSAHIVGGKYVRLRVVTVRRILEAARKGAAL